jgi:hypothetical protein
LVFVSFLHCKGTAKYSSCKQKEELLSQNITFVDLSQDGGTILTLRNTIFAKSNDSTNKYE